MAFPIENFLSPNLTNMLITLVIPFLIIFGLLLFALRRTRVLGDNRFIYVLISLGLTIMIYAIKPNVFQFLASYLFQLGVAGSIIAIGGAALLILLGIIKWGYKTSKALGGDEQRIKDVREEMGKISKKFASRGFLGVGGSDVGQREQIIRRLKDLEQEERMLLARRRRTA